MSFKSYRAEMKRRRERHKKHGYSLALWDVMKLIRMRRDKLMSKDWLKSEEERRIIDKVLNDIQKSAFANDSFKSLRNKIKIK